jgi:phage I-like protein
MLLINNKKYFELAKVGVYNGKVELTAEKLKRMADCYDINWQQAPIWIGHPDEKDSGSKEPQALGWIEHLIFMNNTLYGCFTDVSDELRSLIDNKKFKYRSIEIYHYSEKGKEDYLGALGLTNVPAVKGLEPIQLKEHKYNHSFTSVTTYSNFTNQNTNTMNQYLLLHAKTLGIDILKFSDDAQLSAEIEKVSKAKADKLTALETEVTTLKASQPAGAGTTDNAKITELQTEVQKLKDEKAIALVDDAINSGKIIPAKRDVYIAMTKVNYENMKSVFADMKPDTILTDDQVKDNVAGASPVNKTTLKALMDKHELKNYNDYLAKCLKDPDFHKNFTVAQVEEIKKQSAR